MSCFALKNYNGAAKNAAGYHPGTSSAIYSLQSPIGEPGCSTEFLSYHLTGPSRGAIRMGDQGTYRKCLICMPGH